MLNERVAEKSKLHNNSTQTDERKISSSAQTDNLKQLGGLQPFRASMISTDSESEDEEVLGTQFIPGPSSNLIPAILQKPQRKRGLSRKKLYIYNIGD